MKEMFVTCPSSLEELLVQELKALDIKDVHKGFRGVYAPQKMEYVYKINYGSRLATRVLWPILNFSCRDRDDLYRKAKDIPWSKYVQLEQTFAIDANVSHPQLRHSQFAALVVKDALCDSLRDELGARPNVDRVSPDVQFHLFIHQGKATISLDTSGAPLYKRGYRLQNTEAPLQESLAAAILYMAQYTSVETLCDPFCGSGTFLIEAAMIATRTPSGFFRKRWGFLYHPDFLESEWLRIKAEMDGLRTSLEPGKIMGADKDPKALKICQTNLEAAGFQNEIKTAQSDVRSYIPPHLPTFVVANPPYGKRLETSIETYRSLGKFFTMRCKGPLKAYVLAPDPALIKTMGFPFQKVLTLSHGGLEVSLFFLEPSSQK